MKKGIVWICIFALIATLLVGCGGKDEPKTTSDDNGKKTEVSNNGDTNAPSVDSDKEYNLRCAGIYAPDYPITESLNRAADTIREKTGGKVNIKVYPSNQLGDWSTVYEEVMNGTIEMASCMVGTSFDPRFELLMLPYIANDYETSLRIFAPGSNYWDILTDIFADGGVHLLNIYLDGYMGVGATKIERDGLMDPLKSKGLTYRCPGTKAAIKSAEGLGYMFSTIPYAETYTAIQTGIVDGWMGGPAFLNNQSFSDIIDYFIDYRYCMETQPTFINADILASMPQEYQDIIIETFKEEGKRAAEEREAFDNKALKELEEKGIEVIVATDEEVEMLSDHFRTNIWPEFEGDIGKENLEKLMQDIENK